MEWLQEMLRSDFAIEFPALDAHPAPPAGDDEEAIVATLRREWRRRWRRLQLPEQLSAYTDAVEAARTPAAVHQALAAHVTGIVGAYRTLILHPAGESGRLEGEAAGGEPAPWLDAAAVPAFQVVRPDDVRPGARYAGLAPLFGPGRAVAVAVACCADGAVALVERRRERDFEDIDGELVQLLCTQADAALRRVRLLGARYAELTGAERSLPARADEVFRYAWVGATLGEPVTAAVLRVEVEGEAEMRRCVDALRREVRGAGPLLRRGRDEFLLVLHCDEAAAGKLLKRVRGVVDAGVRIETTLTPQDPTAGAGGLRRLLWDPPGA